MRNSISRLVATGVITSLAVLTIGVPVAASSGKATIAIVNGIPGKKIDICINGKEVRSGLRYGAKTIVRRSPGKPLLKIYKRDARKCRGVKLMQRRITLVEHSDLTLVATKRAPKLLVFDNAGLGPLPAAHDPEYAYRNASDLGAVNIYVGPVSPVAPALAPPIFNKGDQLLGHTDLPDLRVILATYPGKFKPIAGPVAVYFKTLRRHEIMVVGTKPRNAKIVKLLRAKADPI